MIIPGDYKGCRIFIHGRDGRDVACTSIEEHDKVLDLIVVEGVYEDLRCNEVVMVLIVTKNAVHEYGGTVRRVMYSMMTTEIALFKGKIRENRAAERYPIKTQGDVRSLVVSSSLIPLLHPLEIFIENLSSVGALIKGKPDCFSVDMVIEMNFTIGNNDTTMFGKVIRIKETSQDLVEYGCKFIFLN